MINVPSTLPLKYVRLIILLIFFFKGCSNNLINLRKDLETRTGVNGKALRIEKVRYTGKEAKTVQGCPLAKSVIKFNLNNKKEW